MAKEKISPPCCRGLKDEAEVNEYFGKVETPEAVHFFSKCPRRRRTV